METITFECPDCKRRAEVARMKTDPLDAVRVVLQCNYCDDGDRHSPEFYDASGKWVADDYSATLPAAKEG